jgi:hypothetical protein
MTLIEVQGLIANVAIESPGHDGAYNRITLLIEKFGPFRTVDFDVILPLLYRG